MSRKGGECGKGGKPEMEVEGEWFIYFFFFPYCRQVKKSTLNPNAHEFKPRFNAQVSQRRPQTGD